MPSPRSILPGREQRSRLFLEIAAIVFSVLFALAVNGWRENAALREKAERVRETIRREVETNRARVEASLAHHRALLADLQTGTRVMERVSWERLGADPEAAEDPDQLARLLRPLANAALGEELALVVSPVEPDSPLARDHGVRYRVEIDGEPVHVRWDDEGLEVLGSGNIALQPAGLGNTAWDTLQVSGAALLLDVELLERASALHEQQDWYRETVSKAVDLLYSANVTRAKVRPRGFLPTLHDLADQEEQLLEGYDGILALLDRTG